MGIFLFSSVSASAFFLCIMITICPIRCDNLNVRPESRIIFGKNTTEGEFPHQVAVISNSSFCGGSILNSDYILTAAHCMRNVSQTGATIVAGKHQLDFKSLKNLKPGGDSAEIIMHPCFNPEFNIEEENPVNDIAIIKLAKPLPLNARNIKTIKIDEKNMAVEGKFTGAIGWGRISADGGGSEILKVVTLRVITKFCKNNTQPDLEPESQICTGNPNEFVCEGDSGGPLLCDDGTRTNSNVVCGIASYADNFDKNKTRCHGPSYFTRVHHYRNWINSVLAGKKYSAEGCVGKRFLPEPSRGLPSHRPNDFFCEICFISIFLPFWGKKIILYF